MICFPVQFNYEVLYLLLKTFGLSVLELVLLGESPSVLLLDSTSDIGEVSCVLSPSDDNRTRLYFLSGNVTSSVIESCTIDSNPSFKELIDAANEVLLAVLLAVGEM